MKQFFIFAAAALTLAACSKDSKDASTINGQVEAKVTAGVDNPETKADDNVWEADVIGVMVTSSPNSTMTSMYKNVQYATTATTSDAATFTASGQDIYFQDATETVTFAAYGPYQSSTDIATLPGTEGIISDVSTSSQATREAQAAFDWIYASEATASKSSPDVNFAFSHKMARLVITVNTSTDDGFAASDVTGGTYKISGLMLEGTFDTTTGTAAASGTATSDWSLTSNCLSVVGNTEVTFTAILYPQTLTEALTFTATINDQDYTVEFTPALTAGNSYSYTITAKKTALTISGCTVAAWGDGGSDSGTATM